MLHEFTPAQESISFPTVDGGIVYANVYGRGDRGVVLAHGGRFNKESWDRQAQIVVAAGFHVLAFDFRGHGRSRGPANGNSREGRRFDVLGSVNYLRKIGAGSVSVIGASMGGDYAAEAAEAEEEEATDSHVDDPGAARLAGNHPELRAAIRAGQRFLHRLFDGGASHGGAINMALAPRQPGSALKPFIYGLGFEDGLIHPETLIDDRPVLRTSGTGDLAHTLAEVYGAALAGSLLPLGPVTPFRPAEMHNLIGDQVEDWPRLMADPTAHLHLYGKAEARPGRKMGHVTRLKG